MRKLAILLLLAAGTGVASNAHAASNTLHTKTKIPTKTHTQVPTPAAPQPQTYTVVDGDSLSAIAAANNLPSWLPLWDVNTNLQNPDQITPGEQLTIPALPYPTTDRPLPAGYDAPAPAAVVTASVTTTAVVAAPLIGAPGGLAQRVCLRESGCNYAEDTGNGYYGAYQFSSGTWGDYDGYVEANLAPPAVQDAKFQAEYAVRGCSPWPNTCY